jgi:hypothetical protein
MNAVGDWSHLEDGAGDATEVPKLIAALAASKKGAREGAFVELADVRLVHEGKRFPAALPAVHLLLEQLARAKHPGRASILELLARIAVGSPRLYALHTTGLPSIDDLAGEGGLEGACFRAVRDGKDAFVELLGAKDAPTRVQAAMTLAVVVPEAALEALVTKIGAETEESVAIAQSLALGVAGLLARRPVSIPAPKKAGVALRAAAAVGQALSGGPADAEAIGVALSQPFASIATPIGPLGDVAASAALALGDEGVALLERTVRGSSGEHPLVVASALVQAAFPEAAAERPRAPLRSIATLSPAQLRVARLLASLAPRTTWAPLSLLPGVGMTRSLPDLRRFVGLAARGPLERTVDLEGREVEAVVVLDALARGEIAESIARAVLLAGQAPEERVALALAAADNVYELHLRSSWSAERAVAFATSLLAGDPSALPELERRAGAFEEVRHWGRWVLLASLLELLPRDRSVAPVGLLLALAPTARGDHVGLLRAALARAPAEDRDRVALETELPDVVERCPTIMGRAVAPSHGGWQVLDLAANRLAAARRGVRAMATWTKLPNDAPEVRPLDEAKRALAALAPEVVVAIDEAMKSATPWGKSILRSVAKTVRGPTRD